MCRGDARQRIFNDEADHQRLIDGLALAVIRFGWEWFRFALRGLRGVSLCFWFCASQPGGFAGSGAPSRILQNKSFEVRDKLGGESPVSLVESIDQAADHSGDDLELIF